MKVFLNLKGVLVCHESKLPMTRTTLGSRGSSTHESCGSQVGRQNVDRSSEKVTGLGEAPGDH